MLRTLRIILEIFAGLVGLVAIFGLLLIWRLNTGPIRSVVATPYFEAAIEGLVPGTHVQIAHTLVSWDNTVHSVALHVDDLRIFQSSNDVIAEVPSVDIQLNIIGILIGQFLPTELMIDHPQLKLERGPDGSFYFGGMPTGDHQDTNVKDSLARIAHHLTHAYFTRALQINRAVFDVHDTATNSDWSVHVPQIILEHKEGNIAGDVMLEVTQKDQASTVDIHYFYDRTHALHHLLTRFAGITPSFFAGGHPATLGLNAASLLNLPLTGEIDLGFDGNLDIASGKIQLHGDEGYLNDQNFWDRPRAVKSLDIRGNYNRQEGQMELSSAAIDFGGPHMNMSGTGKAQLLSSHKFNITLTMQLDNWPMDQYGQLWPKPIIADARTWIATNLSKGKFDHGDAIFSGTLDVDNPGAINITEGKGKMAASNGSVKYMDSLPPVEGVNAEAVFDLNQMTIKISSGNVGDIRIEPFTLSMTGFEDQLQYIDIPLKVEGPLPSLLQLIDYPPLNYAKKVGLTPDDVDGKAEGTVVFHFPLVKDLDVQNIDVKANADLVNINSSKLVKNIDITQGNLSLNLDSESFEIKGPAFLNKVPLQVLWHQNFSQDKGQIYRQMTVTGGLTADQWQSLGIDVFNGSHGPIAVDLNVTQPDKTHTLYTGAFDMTSADVHIDQLNWKKLANVAATLKFSAEKTDNGDISITSIEGNGPQMEIKGRAVFSAGDEQISSLELDPIIIGRTHAALHFSQPDGLKGAMHFDVEGASFDASGLKGGKDPERANPRPKEYHIDVSKLFTSTNGIIQNAKGYAIRDTQGWSEISLHGLADASAPLAIELTKKSDGGRSLTVSCDDFGKALKGMGFTDTVRDGKLYIYGESDPDTPRVITGTASIGSFTVGQLPVLAVLMNAASPFGFAGLFTDSMEFSDLKGKFRWGGEAIDLIGIHAAGAAVGLNINGRVDMDSGDANLRGTMVPFSVMNGMINSIPLIGDLITGGKGEGVFAVSYSVKGPLADPHINVNPVSLLTPGILRNLFFGGDEEEDAPEPEPAPKN